jgi:UPF0755 protein
MFPRRGGTVRFVRRAVFGGVLAALAAGIFLAALLAWDWHRPYAREGGEHLVAVPRGMRAGQVLDLLVEEGVARSRISLKLAFALHGRPRGIRAGTYRFDRPLTPLQVVDKLNRGEVVYAKVTIPEGLRREEVARLLAEAGLGKEAGFLRVVGTGALVRDLDPQAETLEGYLFPDTYLMDPGRSEGQVVEALLKNLRQWWEAHRQEAGGRSIRQVVTLASLVERETGEPTERGLVAGVFLNRLRLGMPLQTDPSIIYAQVQAGVYRGALTREDWLYPSPYNTYLHPGLPPGPICSPGRASLEAALRPTPSPYLYFVAKSDGTHAFSRTLAEHNDAVARLRGRNGHARPAPTR